MSAELGGRLLGAGQSPVELLGGLLHSPRFINHYRALGHVVQQRIQLRV